ncbi:MAG: hypothetical protein ACK502_04185 [Alphaproteobacteria bacterium]
MTLFLIVIVLISILTAGSYWFCWQDILRGRPNILSMRQITLIMDRNKLDAIFGRHQPDFYYTLTPEMLAALVRSRKFFVYSEIAAEVVCFIGAYRYLTGAASLETVWVFILLAAICEGIDIWMSITLIRKYWYQIEEEMGGGFD